MQGFIGQLHEWIETHLTRRNIVIIVIALMLLAFWGGSVYHAKQEQGTALSLVKTTATATESTADSTTASTPVSEVKVHVTGAVSKPGVYTLTTDDRIDDAVRLAGVTAEADLSKLNLAQRLSDGQKIVVPAYGETPATAITSSEEALININTATTNDLMKLPGVGEVRANAMIAYREAHGGFKTIEELKEVSGIGEKSFEQLKPHVTL